MRGGGAASSTIAASAVARAQVFAIAAKVDLADGESAFLELTAGRLADRRRGLQAGRGATSPTTARSRPDARDVRALPRADRRRSRVLHRAGAAGAVKRRAQRPQPRVRRPVPRHADRAGVRRRSPTSTRRRSPTTATRSRSGATCARPSSASTCSRTGSPSTCSSRCSSSAPCGCSSAARRSPRSSTRPGRESDADQKRRRARRPATRRSGRRSAAGARWLFSNSLLLVMGAIWLASWLGQSVTGRVVYNAERFDHQQAAVELVAVPRHARLLEPHAAELAVGVPRRRLDGRAVDLPAPARLAGVQAGRRAAHATGVEG